ncbi:ABC transporter substrate-binding protein [Prosthecomicrobium sp. N25]|uniref:ABC transporter substrate-binding protein n=1 Tax=Prosthecomicrobium sp. N25 TaxID=3129254 RepID=UPI0030781DDF
MRPVIRFAASLAAAMLASAGAAEAQKSHLRIAMTAADVPTTTGMPNNGAEGMRFAGYPVFEPLVDWDLFNAVDKRAGFRPALATQWAVEPENPTRWVFKLREGVKFHDGTDFNADVVLWNLSRLYDDKSPQFEAAASGIARSRAPQLVKWEKTDDFTVVLTTTRPLSFFPMLMAWIPFVSPTAWEKAGRNWNEFAKAPVGTGPFRITKVNPRVSIEMEKFPGHWNPQRIAKSDKVTLFPMPEANTRLAALRSGQVDWIEVPPPDAIPSLKQAGYKVTTKIYPHIWPWVFSFQDDSPFKDKRVRYAANYAVDREGLVKLLNGTALPATGFVTDTDAQYGKPKVKFGYDPEKAKALLKEAGYDEKNPAKIKVMISTSGSGQMMPIPMNELIQQNLEAVGFKVEYDVVEWGTMLLGFRQPPDSAINKGRHAMNISLSWTDPSVWFRFFHSEAATPTSSNWAHWKNAEFDAILDKVATTYDPVEQEMLLAKAHEILVEESPWLWIVHDLNPRAFSAKVQGYVPQQSWMQDFTQVVVK